MNLGYHSKYCISVHRYASEYAEPPIDTDSQVTQTMAVHSDGMMRMQFMRPIVSNDTQVCCIVTITTIIMIF